MRLKVSSVVGATLVFGVLATGLLLWQGRARDAQLPVLARDAGSFDVGDDDAGVRGSGPRGANGTSSESSVPEGGPEDGGARLLFRAPWGSGPGQVGRSRPSEGNPEGPMSFAVVGDDVVVVDQVNGRLVRYGRDGRARVVAEIAPTAQDVVAAKDGTLAVLDRFGTKDVTLLDANGRRVGALPLEGKGLEQAGTTTGLFVDGKKVYAERDHGGLVLLGSTDGSSDGARTELSGRPSKDGTLLVSAGLVPGGDGRVYVNAFDRAKGALRFTQVVRFGARLSSLVLLDTDARGTIYVGAWPFRGDAPGGALVVVCLEPAAGKVLGHASTPASQLPEETFRELAVAEDGRIVQALGGEDGLELRELRCP